MEPSPSVPRLLPFSIRWRWMAALAMLLLVLVACRPATPALPASAAPGENDPVVEALLPTVAPPPTSALPAVATSVPTATATAAPRATLPPEPEATSSATAMPTATMPPTPTPTPRLRQLLSGGCCVNPMWSPDGATIRFIDRPAPDLPAGIYEVPANLPGPVIAGTLYTTTLPTNSSDERFFIDRTESSTRIEDRLTGEAYVIPSEGNDVTISPNGSRVIWQVRDDNDSPSRDRLTTFWSANLDGSDARQVATVRGGSLSGWLGEDALLLQQRDEADPDERLLVRLDLKDGSATVLDRALRFSGLVISRGGHHVAYYISLDQDDPEQNRLWVLDAASGMKQPLPVTGAYRWRDATRLLVVPMELDAPSFRLQEFDVTIGARRDLTDPATLPFRIANNDWAVSPDGFRVVFVSADDGNLWLIDLEGEQAP